MNGQHSAPPELLDAADDLWDAQQRLVQTRRSGASENEVILAEQDRDRARQRFDDLLEQAEADG